MGFDVYYMLIGSWKQWRNVSFIFSGTADDILISVTDNILVIICSPLYIRNLAL